MAVPVLSVPRLSIGRLRLRPPPAPPSTLIAPPGELRSVAEPETVALNPPPLLVSEVEVQKKAQSLDALPIVSAPAQTRK